MTSSAAPCYTLRMKSCLLMTVLLLLALPGLAQNREMPKSVTPSANIPQSANTLQIDPDERQFFALGITLVRGAFAYAELAKATTEVAETRSKIAQVGKLSKLAPLAERNRREAGIQITRAMALMHLMNAPASAQAPVVKAARRLAESLPITSDAQSLLLFNRDAARTLSSLNEFDTLSSLPEDPAIRKWLDMPAQPRSSSVWYGEGEIAGLAQIAAAREMPGLLPSVQQIATDLRGLRDWLSLRLPDAPSPEQVLLKKALEAFLRETASVARPGVKSRKLLTGAQLQALGNISRQLQAQVLRPEENAPLPETAARG